MRIYEMLMQWKNTKHKKLTIELEELKERLGAKGKYERMIDFEKYVLTPAKEEINAISDILIDYKKLTLGEAKGRGRKPISHIEFSFKIKTELLPETDLLTEEQIRELMEIAKEKTQGTDKTAKEYYDYCFNLTDENCKNNKGFYKYIKTAIEGDNTLFFGQLNMFNGSSVRQNARQKSNEVQNAMTKERKEKIEKGQAEKEERERLFKERKI